MSAESEWIEPPLVEGVKEGQFRVVEGIPVLVVVKHQEGLKCLRRGVIGTTVNLPEGVDHPEILTGTVLHAVDGAITVGQGDPVGVCVSAYPTGEPGVASVHLDLGVLPDE